MVQDIEITVDVPGHAEPGKAIEMIQDMEISSDGQDLTEPVTEMLQTSRTFLMGQVLLSEPGGLLNMTIMGQVLQNHVRCLKTWRMPITSQTRCPKVMYKMDKRRWTSALET